MVKNSIIIISTYFIVAACAAETQPEKNTEVIEQKTSSQAATSEVAQPEMQPDSGGQVVLHESATSRPFPDTAAIKTSKEKKQAYPLNLASLNNPQFFSLSPSLISLTVNDSENEVSIKENEKFEVGIKFLPGSEQYRAEYFLVLQKADGSMYHYCPQEWCQGVDASFVGPLLSIKKNVGIGQDLGPGSHTLMFAIDDTINNGKLDLNPEKSLVKFMTIHVK